LYCTRYVLPGAAVQAIVACPTYCGGYHLILEQ
jgi:hypothetical protein